MPPSAGNSTEHSGELLAAAEGGDTAALGQLMELFRNYLTSIAREELGGALQDKVNPSDVVQDTYLEACRVFSQFQGSESEEFRGWLRGILLNKLRDLYKRYFDAQNRQVDREHSLDDSHGGGTPLRQALPGTDSTPSGHFARREEEERLLAALGRLPEEYRTVVIWRNWESLGFAEIGKRLGKSEDATRMLYGRAIDRLEKELGT